MEDGEKGKERRNKKDGETKTEGMTVRKGGRRGRYEFGRKKIPLRSQ